MSYDSEVLADSPIGYWKLNEGTGTTAIDSGPNAKNGTYKASPGLTVEGPFGALDKAMQITAASKQFVEIPDVAALRWVDLVTHEFWIKEPAKIETNWVIGKGTNSLSSRIQNETIRMLKANVGEAMRTTNNVITPTSPWTHVALVKNAATTRLIYINGVVQAMTTSTQTGAETTGYLAIGKAGSTNEEYGTSQLSRVAIYKSALTAERVLKHYEAREVLTAGGPRIRMLV